MSSNKSLDGVHLHHLRFADDAVILISSNIKELNNMLNQLNEEIPIVGK